MKRVLLATDKPFAAKAVSKIQEICDKAGYQLVKLESYTSAGQLKDAVKDVHAVIVRSDLITKEIIDAAPELKIVVRGGAGYDNVDCIAASKKGVVVMNTPGVNSNAVAELAMGMAVYMARGLFTPKTGGELLGKKIGIHAYGNVGKNVARIAKGFGMTVYAFDPFVKKDVIEADGVKVVETVEDLYKTCHYVSLHIPANDKTKKSINKNLMGLMPKGATLLNTARKEVVCEEGLKFMLESRPDFKYASDIAPDNAAELNEKFAGRVFFTPKKMGAQTNEANDNAAEAAISQIVRFFEKGDITFKVN
ncbi:MAG TPA: NAD(P)-dependent oxidoreductase [bacterium]|nr:NAD(P)-dependent oxidoreductase [bacterium]